MGIFSALLPKSHTFFDDFEEIAAHAVAAAGELVRLSRSWPEEKTHLRSIRDHEHQADDIAHSALGRLDRTFQTPIYREDIHDMVQTLDSVIDTVKATADRLEVFHIDAVGPAFIGQAEVLVATTTAVAQSMKTLRTDRKLPALLGTIIDIHEHENKANDNHERVISTLFVEPREVLDVMRWKELHELLLRAVDQCEDVANIVERIAIQNS